MHFCRSASPRCLCQGFTHAADVACGVIALEGFCRSSRPWKSSVFLFLFCKVLVQGLTHAADVACGAIALEGFCRSSRPCRYSLSFFSFVSVSSFLSCKSLEG